MNLSRAFRLGSGRVIRAAWGLQICLLSFIVAGCGGGGSATPEIPEAVVQSIVSAQVLEGSSSGGGLLQFLVTLDKPAVKGVIVSFATGSTAKPGVDSTGSATGGVCGAVGVDFASATSQISVAAGAQTGQIAVQVCADGTFEPNETMKITWSSVGSAGGSVVGTIVNDDAGGLNGSGAINLLGELPASGRDANPLTNSSADGALGFSFDKSRAQCVADKVTGLTWQTVHTTTKTFADLDAYVATINASAPCGIIDWRVPTVDQLLGLLDASKTFGSPMNADYFGSAPVPMQGKFWSRESRATAGPSSVDAWQVDTSNGGAVSFGPKSDALGVRLVSGDGSTPQACSNASLRFEDLNDGTIADRTTGLMWKKCPEGYTNSACTAGTVLSFSSAAQVIGQLNSVNATGSSLGVGYSDWRVPTRNELASLVVRACTAPATLNSIFPNTGSLAFVSSTLDANAPASRVWGVDFAEGGLGPSMLSGPFRLRLVRAGQ